MLCARQRLFGSGCISIFAKVCWRDSSGAVLARSGEHIVRATSSVGLKLSDVGLLLWQFIAIAAGAAAGATAAAGAAAHAAATRAALRAIVVEASKVVPLAAAVSPTAVV